MTLLIVLAALLTIGQILTQWRLSAVQDELWIIRYAALQRHQSQQIVKQALQLADPSERTNFTYNVAELRQVFPKFEKYHLQVRQGRVPDHDIAIPNSDSIQQLYNGIRPQFEAFQRSVRQLMTLQQPDEINQPVMQASLRLLLANEKPFLEKMDGIVREYTGELRTKLTRLQVIEFYLYGISIAVLIGIGVWIFRPAARKLRQTIAQLIEAESQTTAANRELLNVNKSLKETRQKLFEATKEQYERQIDEQKLRTSYLIAGQEDERKRLSRELHDGLGQMLTAIKLQIEGLEAGMKRSMAVPATGNEPVALPVYARNISNLKKLVTQTIQETRTISNNLMPTVLSDFGIVPALKMLAENDRSDQVDVTFETNLAAATPRWDKNVEIMLYRVAQEAVSNAVRHAYPSHVHIELIEREKFIHLLVTDDGRGFRLDEHRLTASTNGRIPSQGLHNMHERAKLLNGKLKITSVPGKGTKIQISIPYQMQSAHYDAN
nr:sensor histidine kinase [Spirosoma taeanense]